jgi:DNA (cytosine-5)-methyltransferase 1
MLYVGSLFSGIGGIELGLERTGFFETKWFIENDIYCQAVLRKHWSQCEVYGDITYIDWSKMPKVDVLTGGFPCQDISQAGRGKGIIDGKRSSLWKHYAESIRILRPKYAIIENVPMLYSRGLNVVLADIAQAGYNAEWFTLQASYFGAPHKRERMFIIAYPCGKRFIHLRLKKQSGQGRESAQSENSPGFITDDWSQRIQRFKQKKIQRKQGFSWCEDVRRIEDLRGRQDIPEPLFCGGRDGIPNWMDRIKSCGNSVVPECAEFIGERLKEIEGL